MNELTQFNEGGTHSQNPLGGIPVGGNNTVEQGETKNGSFVYSNRIKLTPEIIKQYNLPKSLANKTVADATKFIDGKFKDRTDKISMSTKQDMLSKIAEAQEAMKPQEPVINPEQNQMFLGGDTLEADLMPGVASATGALTSLVSGDTDGAVSGITSSLGSIGGTAIGGPIGGMIGGALGSAVGGLINGIGAGDKRRNAENSQHIIESNKFNNDFAYGGKMYADGGSLPMLTPEQITRFKTPYGGLEKTDYMSNRGKDLNLQTTNTILNNSLPENELYGDLINKYPNRNPKLQGYKPDATISLTENDLVERNLYSDPGIAPLASTTNMGVDPNKPNTLPKADLSKLGNTLGQAARYAPIAMNAYQLSQLEKPGYSRLNRLDQRFNPEYVDERSLQNIVSNETNNTVNALTGATNGSTGALRSNILGAGLNRTKAMSDAYMNAEAQNRATNVQGQQFNAGINQANLNQSNAELDINDRNSAAYRNTKREYLTGIGEGIGDIGKEETFKKIASTTTGYNFLGKYMANNPKATKEDAIEAAKKEGIIVEESKPNALGGYLFNKNKKK